MRFLVLALDKRAAVLNEAGKEDEMGDDGALTSLCTAIAELTEDDNLGDLEWIRDSEPDMPGDKKSSMAAALSAVQQRMKKLLA